MYATPYQDQTRHLSGFAARVRSGFYGHRQQVAAPSVASALSAVGKAIVMAININPVKAPNSNNFALRLQQMIDGWERDDPPPVKKLSVEVGVLELLAFIGCTQSASE